MFYCLFVFLDFTSWAYYRRGEGKFTPADIKPELCTHIVYAFAGLDETSIISQDTGVDFDQGYYKGVTDLRAKGKKVMLALGGWIDSGKSFKYSNMVNDPSKRASFITNTVRYLKENNFDGLEIDWEYPVCWQVGHVTCCWHQNQRIIRMS